MLRHKYLHTCIHTHIHKYIYTCIHTYLHACIHACIHTTYIHICIHTHTHTHTYIQTYIHICTKNSEICYYKISKSEIERQESETTTAKWQQQWDATAKGLVTKEYFPNIKARLKMKLSLSPNFTAMVTTHGKTKAHPHRFKIIQSSECVCTHGYQTTDHLIFDCDMLDKERGKLIAHIER